MTGPVVFRDDFSNPANPNGWGGPNTASYFNIYSGGIYQIVLSKPHTYYWSVPNTLDRMKGSLANVRIDVDARLGPGKGSAVLGIICRSNDKNPASFYQFALDRSPVAIGVARIVPPAYPLPARFYRLPAGIVDLTTFNHYEVICRGGTGGHPVQLRLAINGKEIVNSTNPAGTRPLRAGAAGVILESFGSEPVSAEFDNFVVRRIAP